MKLREEYEQMAQAPYPWTDRELLWDEENSFAYLSKNEVVVGYDRNEETFWRNVRETE